VDPLATRSRLLEIEAELQRALLALRIESARRQSVPGGLLPVLGVALKMLLQRRFRWLGPAWIAARWLRLARPANTYTMTRRDP
jgi:hypothetical protein